jgi:type I restriction enzyme S subunit
MIEVNHKIQCYVSYKNSGIEWLGEIPEHWKIESFKNILTERNEKNAPIKTKEILSLSIDKGVTLYAEKTTNLDRFKDDFSKYKLAHKGDLVFNSMNMIVGAVGVSDYFGCVSPVYYTYHGDLNNPYTTKFYEYLFRSKRVQGVLYSLGKGLIAIDRGDGKYNTLRLKVSRDDLRSMKLPLPNFAEQTLIVDFLDHKTTKIDEAITIKEQQISLLKERKQILIHKAVTRGLNPTVTLKDSGVEWIGEIPEHWEVKKLKQICKAFGRIGFRGYTTSDLVNEGEGAITISPSNIKEEFMTFKKCSYLSWKKYDESPEIQISNNDVLIVKTGSTFGKVGIVKELPQKATINPQILVLKEIKINPDYFYSTLKTSMIQTQVKQEVIGSTIPTISETKILNFKIALPPQKEIENTIVYLKDVSNKFKTAIHLKQQEIAKLKEYKSSLINSVVTGKVKVC